MAINVRTPCDEAAIRAGRVDPDCHRKHARWVLVAAILGSSMAFIDGTVVTVALPSIQRELGADAAQAEWVMEAYTLLLSALLLVGGALGDRYGRRKVFGIGVLLFAVTSAACGASTSADVLIGARALQGAAAALLVPGSLALISAVYDEDERGRAIGTWSGASAITAAIGPVIGGLLVGHASWRWAFFVNLPLAVAVLVLVATRLPESRDPEAKGRLDIAGAGLVSVGLGALVYGVIRAQSGGFDVAALIAVVAGTALLIAFAALEVRLTRAGRNPMLSTDLFRSRPFTAANLLTLLLYAALGGALFYVPFDLIEVHGYSPAAAGASLLPFVLILSFLSRWSGGLVSRYGPRGPLTIGPLVAAAGFALYALPGTGGSYWTTFFPAATVLGAGMAIAVAPLTTTVMGSVETRHAGAASGVNNAVARVAGLLAIALLGIVLVRGFDTRLDQRLRDRGVQPQVAAQVEAQRAKLALASPPKDAPKAQREAARAAVDDAFVDAFRLTALVAAALAAASGAVGAIGLPPRRQPARRTAGEHPEAARSPAAGMVEGA